MTSDELEQKEKEIQAEIDVFAEKNHLSAENLFPIYDGIYSVEKYLSAPLRLMWVLKEPYDDIDDKGNACGGGWSITKDLFKNPIDYAGGNLTARMITRLSYCLLSEAKFEQTKDFTTSPQILNSLQSIAYCNISKMPAGTTTDDSTLPAKYELWKEILMKQLKTYSPDVVIFGSTFNYFVNDLFGGNYPEMRYKFGMAKGFVKEGQLLVSAYHPRFPKNEENQDNYASEILKVVKMWKNERR